MASSKNKTIELDLNDDEVRQHLIAFGRQEQKRKAREAKTKANNMAFASLLNLTARYPLMTAETVLEDIYKTLTAAEVAGIKELRAVYHDVGHLSELVLGSNQHYAGLGGYLLKLKGEAVIKPELVLPHQALFGTVAVYDLHMDAARLSKTARQQLVNKLKPAIEQLQQATPPSIARNFNPENIEYHRQYHDLKGWNTFLPKHDTTVSIVTKNQKLYLVISTHVGDVISGELVAYLNTKSLTAQQLAELPQIAWVRSVAKRNVQRVGYVLMSALKGATDPMLVSARRIDHHSATKKYTHAPFYLKPQWSYTFNTMSWDANAQILSIYHWVTNGVAFDPVQILNNVFVSANPVRGVLSVPSMANDIIPIRTSVLSDAVEEIESSKVVRVTEQTLGDFVDFVAMPFHELPFKEAKVIEDNIFKLILTFN